MADGRVRQRRTWRERLGLQPPQQDPDEWVPVTSATVDDANTGFSSLASRSAKALEAEGVETQQKPYVLPDTPATRTSGPDVTYLSRCCADSLPRRGQINGMKLDVSALFATPGAVAKIFLFFVLFLIVRGAPALLLYRNVLNRDERYALALLSSTQLRWWSRSRLSRRAAATCAPRRPLPLSARPSSPPSCSRWSVSESRNGLTTKSWRIRMPIIPRSRQSALGRAHRSLEHGRCRCPGGRRRADAAQRPRRRSERAQRPPFRGRGRSSKSARTRRERQEQHPEPAGLDGERVRNAAREEDSGPRLAAVVLLADMEGDGSFEQVIPLVLVSVDE